MSQPLPEIDELLWEQYISSCRADKTTPNLSDYLVWLEDQDLDKDTEDYYEY